MIKSTHKSFQEVNECVIIHMVIFCRHVIFAPGTADSYSGVTFPGLTDALFRIDSIGVDSERKQQWREVARQLSILTYFIQSAADLLEEPIDFMKHSEYV